MSTLLPYPPLIIILYVGSRIGHYQIPQWPTQLNFIRREPSRGSTGASCCLRPHIPAHSCWVSPDFPTELTAASQSLSTTISYYHSRSWQARQSSPAARPQAWTAVLFRSRYLFQVVSQPMDWRHHHQADSSVGRIKWRMSVKCLTCRKYSVNIYLVLKIKLMEERRAIPNQSLRLWKDRRNQTVVQAELHNGCARNGFLVWPSDPKVHCLTWNNCES